MFDAGRPAVNAESRRWCASSASIPALPTPATALWRAVGGAPRRARRRRHRDAAGDAVERRLAAIHAGVAALIAEHEPDAVALEELYFGANARSAFAVGQARGVVMLAAGQARLPCARLHPAAGQERGLRQWPRRQGPGRADGPGAAVAARAADARPCLRRSRRRDLPRQPCAAGGGAAGGPERI